METKGNSPSMIEAWTDYPMIELGDEPNEFAPVRKAYVISYDGNKYCEVVVEGVVKSIKSGYLYQKKGRGNTPTLTKEQLSEIEV